MSEESSVDWRQDREMLQMMIEAKKNCCLMVIMMAIMVISCIGGFAPVYVAQEIATGQFTIAGGYPRMKVSWQVTGVRQDKWANENRIVVEEVKPANERGYYLHPKLFGLTEKRSVEWGRDPEGMREMAELSKGIKYTSQRKK